MFLVRKGNPKGIKDWGDLVEAGRAVITPNPKTSGGARWNYLAAWGYALKQPGGTDAKARRVRRRRSTRTCPCSTRARAARRPRSSQRGIGDVLLAWENEAYLALDEAQGKVEIVVPSVSILAEPPVAVVDKVVDRKGTRAVAEAYLQYLYSPEGQEIAAKHHYRPRDPERRGASIANSFAKVKLFTIDEAVRRLAERRRRRTSPTAACSIRSTSRGGTTPHDACAIAAPRVLPGFGLTMGFTMLYLSLIVLDPAADAAAADGDARRGRRSGTRSPIRASSRRTG